MSYLDELISESKRAATEKKLPKKKSEEKIYGELKSPKKKPPEGEGAPKEKNPKPKPIELPEGKIEPIGIEDIDQIPEALHKDIEKKLPGDKVLLAEYGLCKIYKLPKKEVLLYTVPVPRSAGPERTLIDTIKEAATRLITVTPEEIRDPDERRAFYKKRILEIVNSTPELGIPPTKMDFYANSVVREMIGYGPLDLLLADDSLEEIMITGPNKPVYVFHRDYEMMKTNIEFSRDSDILAIIDRIARDVGRRIDVKIPILDARLPDGSRVNATIPPISLEGSTLTIRKFRENPFTIVDLINFGTLDTDLAAFLWVCVEGLGAKPANIMVSGGTSSGKTTTLNTLAAFVPPNERIISIEDTAELKLPVEHWIRFETRPPGIEGTGEVNMDVLVKNSLRMRPDRILVGEIRHAEAFTLFTAMNTGHDGCMGTIHSNSAEETIVRLINPPMDVPTMMISALDMIVVEKRIHDRRKGSIRRITEVAEVAGVMEKEPQTIVLYEWDPATDTIRSTGVPSRVLQEISRYTGLSNSEIQAEIEKRKAFIEDLVNKEIHDLAEVCEAFNGYIGEGS
jgi:flagellar protein FlaI